ncbi:kelch-like protein 10 [Cololabis saira]|uniref:kelch-like protein 10 n=1 Tax=Cololabis saira TaxID=129043 RepID=UPI002AD4701D|nr:kelch-like protein 10 [Cololabis saira]
MSKEEKPSDNSVYNELRLTGEHCDAVIKVEDVEFQVHKVVLCNCTPYFRALFSSHWSNRDKKIFNIPNVSPDTMQLILDHAYTGSVSVTEDNVLDLLIAADQFNIDDVIRSCYNFLEEQMCPENCIGIWQLTNTCFYPKLRSKAFHYITEHFEEVASCEEFLQIPVEELTDIIEKDQLIVKQESTVFEAIIRWINHLPNEREKHIVALLPKVRLALLDMEYFKMKVITSEVVKRNPECYSMISDVPRAIANVIRFGLRSRCFGNRFTRPRMPRSILLAMGGWSVGDPTNSIEAYDIRTNQWTNVPNDAGCPRAYHGTAFLNGYVYFIGGFDRQSYFNSVCRWDPTTHTWQEVAPMYYRRCYVSVTVLNGCIYAIGGYNGHTRLRTAEYYEPQTNQWTCIAPMHEQRSDASCTTLHNKIYICGGFNGQECLETAEYYDPQTMQWTLISPMTCRRSGVGVVAYGDKVYAVGGFDGDNRLRSAECYNPGTNTWNNVASMITTRSNFGIEVMEDLLFVVGGFNGFTTTCSVEKYNRETDEWREVCDMDVFRSALSCCVVFGLPNMADYVPPRDPRSDSVSS